MGITLKERGILHGVEKTGNEKIKLVKEDERRGLASAGHDLKEKKGNLFDRLTGSSSPEGRGKKSRHQQNYEKRSALKNGERNCEGEDKGTGGGKQKIEGSNQAREVGVFLFTFPTAHQVVRGRENNILPGLEKGGAWEPNSFLGEDSNFEKIVRQERKEMGFSEKPGRHGKASSSREGEFPLTRDLEREIR